METSATKKYVEVMREQYKGCSDYRLAQLLQVSKSCISRWKHGNGTIDDEPAARLADLCGLDPLVVLTELHLERSRSRASRQYFEGILKVLDKSEVAVFILFSLLILPAFERLLLA